MQMDSLLDKFKTIDTFVCDVDGVFTNGQLLVSEEGQLLRSMSAKDGFAVRKAIEAGYEFIIITGGRSEGVRLRFQALGVNHIYSGIHDKLSCFNELIQEGIILHPNKCIYMGDDILDLKLLQNVGVSACPKDAIMEVKQTVDYISPYQGGTGCVRDIIEKVLKLHNKWM